MFLPISIKWIIAKGSFYMIYFTNLVDHGFLDVEWEARIKVCLHIQYSLMCNFTISNVMGTWPSLPWSTVFLNRVIGCTFSVDISIVLNFKCRLDYSPMASWILVYNFLSSEYFVANMNDIFLWQIGNKS